MSTILDRKVTPALVARVREKGACDVEANIFECEFMGKTIRQVLKSKEADKGDWLSFAIENDIFSARDLTVISEKTQKTEIKTVNIPRDGWVTQDKYGYIDFHDFKPEYRRKSKTWVSGVSDFKMVGNDIALGRFNSRPASFCKKVGKGPITIKVLKGMYVSRNF